MIVVSIISVSNSSSLQFLEFFRRYPAAATISRNCMTFGLATLIAKVMAIQYLRLYNKQYKVPWFMLIAISFKD